MDHVWYIECSSAGVHEVVATALKGYTSMLLPDEIAGPAAKLKHLQKTAMRHALREGGGRANKWM
jgi:hypothetical protein